jgi:hypothetical protein
MAWAARLELATCGLEIRCSVQLSYAHVGVAGIEPAHKTVMNRQPSHLAPPL